MAAVGVEGQDSQVILGPPGTGKTSTLLSMVESELSRGVPPDRIGYVSFTRRAAQEAVERACARFSLRRGDLRYFRTLHSLCFMSLGLSPRDILTEGGLRDMSNWLGVDISGRFSLEEGSSFGFKPGDRALFMDNLARIRGVSLRQQHGERPDGLDWSLVSYVSRGLAQYKRDRHVLDYTDMLEMFACQDWTPQLEVLFVDEAQDLSALQWRVVERLASTARRVIVAGDDDQAIYVWAGADIQRFRSQPGRRSVLQQSWRVPIMVQTLALGIVQRIRGRLPKEWAPRAESGEVRRVMSMGEVDLRSGQDILVLARNTHLLREIMPTLRSDGIIFEWRGETSVPQETLSAIESWETLRRGGAVSVLDCRRIYALMSAGVGYARGNRQLPGFAEEAMLTMRDLRERAGLLVDAIWHQALDRMPQEDSLYLLRARQHGESLRRRPRVRLSTMHGAKGGEAEHVVILTDMASRTYQESHHLQEDEARVWYVAATRAKQILTVVAPRTPRHYSV